MDYINDYQETDSSGGDIASFINYDYIEQKQHQISPSPQICKDQESKETEIPIEYVSFRSKSSQMPLKSTTIADILEMKNSLNTSNNSTSFLNTNLSSSLNSMTASIFNHLNINKKENINIINNKNMLNNLLSTNNSLRAWSSNINRMSDSDGRNNGQTTALTDFAPKRKKNIFGIGFNSYSSSALVEILRIKYLLFLLIFLCYISILVYFLSPRLIHAWIDDAIIISLKFNSNRMRNISMDVQGMLYVSNPNYLPIILKSMKVELYFSQSQYYGFTAVVDGQTFDFADIFLCSMTFNFNEEQNEKMSDVRYPFELAFNTKLDVVTYATFVSYIYQSCIHSQQYLIDAHFQPSYGYGNMLHKIAFRSAIVSSAGCPLTQPPTVYLTSEPTNNPIVKL